MSAWLIALLVVAYIAGGILTTAVRYFTKGWQSESRTVDDVVFLMWPPFLFVEMLRFGVGIGVVLAQTIESKVDAKEDSREQQEPKP